MTEPTNLAAVMARLKLSAELNRSVAELRGLDAGPKTVLQRLRLANQIRSILLDLGATPAEAAATELSDDPNSPNYRFRDTGYIADSRKEQAQNLIRLASAAGQSVKATDIDWEAIETNPRAAYETITKSNLFGDTDWTRLQEQGMDAGAGFLIDRIYASIAPKPADQSQARRDYTVALTTIRQRLEVCLKPVDVVGVLSEIRSELLGVQLNAEEADQASELERQLREVKELRSTQSREREALSRPFNAAIGVIQKTEYDISTRARRNWTPDPVLAQRLAEAKAAAAAAAEAMQKWDADHPEFKETFVTERGPNGISSKRVGGLYDRIQELGAQRRALEDAARKRNLAESPLTRGWLTFGERFFKLLNYRSYTGGSDAFASHVTNVLTGKIKDWSWATKEAVEVKQATKQEIGFQLKVADRYDRVGGRDVTVDSTSALKKMLGFRDVQSGNWVLRDPNSAKFHVEHTAAAMSDLSDILGIPAASLGLGGRLGMAFGARGVGGKNAASAHYEPIMRVINLTKMGGGGCLGHEWFHAIDNMLGELVSGQATGSKSYATADASTLPEGALRSAMVELQTAMTSGTTRTFEVLRVTPRDRALAKANVGRGTGRISVLIRDAGDATKAVLAVDSVFSTTPMSKNHKTWRRIAAAFYAPEDKDSIRVQTGPMTSNFYHEAVILDGGQADKYWSKRNELGARAFQAYIEDCLSKQERKNDYLSIYADNRHHVDPVFGIEWKPYPEGEERDRINRAFDGFFEAVRKAEVFEKAAANKPLMDAIFGSEDELDLIEHGSDKVLA